MKSSCVTHPNEEPLIIIRKWQVEFCEGNQCAAALLSFFEYWHNIKSASASKNQQFNNVAESYGDHRSQDETLWQWHTEKDISEGILIYKREAISLAIKFLVSKRVIQISTNPNPKYKFDKTRWFLFAPEVLNNWITLRNQQYLKADNRSSENRQSMLENRQGVSENRPAISKTTSKTLEDKEKNMHVLLTQDVCVEAKLPSDSEKDTLKESTIPLEPEQQTFLNQQSEDQEKLAKPPTTKKRSKTNTFICPAKWKQQVDRIFAFWKKELNHPTSLLLPERGRAVVARLEQGYTVEQIEQAILGCKMSPHNQGLTNGVVYDDLELICRSGSKLEHKIGIYLQNKPKAKPTSEKSVEQKAVIERNQPEVEELQNFASYLQEARTQVKSKPN